MFIIVLNLFLNLESLHPNSVFAKLWRISGNPVWFWCSRQKTNTNFRKFAFTNLTPTEVSGIHPWNHLVSFWSGFEKKRQRFTFQKLLVTVSQMYYKIKITFVPRVSRILSEKWIWIFFCDLWFVIEFLIWTGFPPPPEGQRPFRWRTRHPSSSSRLLFQSRPMRPKFDLPRIRWLLTQYGWSNRTVLPVGLHGSMQLRDWVAILVTTQQHTLSDFYGPCSGQQ
jgi:hypothetical protein